MNVDVLKAGDLVTLNPKLYHPRTVEEYGIARVLGFDVNLPNCVIVEFVNSTRKWNREDNESVLWGMDFSRSLSKEEILSSTLVKYRIRYVDLVPAPNTKRIDGGLL